MAEVKYIDLNEIIQNAGLINDYYGEGSSEFLAEMEEKEWKLTERKEELLSQPMSDDRLDEVIGLIEEIKDFEQVLREGYDKYGILTK